MFERDSIYFNRIVTYRWNSDLIPDTYTGAKNKICHLCVSMFFNLFRVAIPFVIFELHIIVQFFQKTSDSLT